MDVGRVPTGSSSLFCEVGRGGGRGDGLEKVRTCISHSGKLDSPRPTPPAWTREGKALMQMRDGCARTGNPKERELRQDWRPKEKGKVGP